MTWVDFLHGDSEAIIFGYTFTYTLNTGTVQQVYLFSGKIC